MAKQRPVPPGGRKPANARDRQATPVRPPTAPTPPGPRRPATGDPSDPRPIAAPFMQHPAPAIPADRPTGTDQPELEPPGPAAHPDRPDPHAVTAEQLAPAAHPDRPDPHAVTAEQLAPRQLGAADAPEATGPYAATAEQPAPQQLGAAGAPEATEPPAAVESHARPHPRTSGRPMPGPRRTPPPEQVGPPADTENPALNAAHPYPDDRPGPERDAPAVERPGSPNQLPGQHGQGHTGNQRSFGPAPARRPETAGVAKVPPPRPVLPGLELQPMVHVDDMAAAVAFYERLGGEVNHGDRDGEWVLMQVGTAQIGLVTRPPNTLRGESTVELNFTATMPLDRLEQLLRARGVTVVQVARDGDLGTQLHLETPDGMPVKIHQVEPDLLI